MVSSPWLVRQPQAQPSMRLFCFSYAGGSAVSYVPWQAALGPEIEVCAVQLPGRGARFGERAFTALPELIVAMASALRPATGMPFAFFGHSLGGLVAFELARYWHRHQQPVPAHLFVSGCNAPQMRNPSRDLHCLSDDALIAELQGYNGTPPEVLNNRDLMSLVLPTIRADFSLVENYRYHPGRLLDLPITVLAGNDDEHTSAPQVAAWDRETSADCRVEWFSGDHFFLRPGQSEVLDCVRSALALDCA
jgi:surfactin synthase thioesterase subunit